MSLLSSVRKDFVPITWLLLAPCIVANGLIGHWVVERDWPLYLDMLGTVFLGATCGPFAGALCGGLTLLLWELILPGYWCWFPVGMVLGLVAGFSVRLGLFKSWSTTVIAALIAAVAAVVASVPIRLFASQGSGAGETVISNFLITMGKDTFEAVISSSFLVELVDKVLVCLLAYLLVRLLPEKLLDRLPQVGKLRNRPISDSPLTVFGGAVALVSLAATFFVTQIISVSRMPHDAAAFKAYSNIPWPWLKDLCVLIADYGIFTALLGATILLAGTMLDE